MLKYKLELRYRIMKCITLFVEDFIDAFRQQKPEMSGWIQATMQENTISRGCCPKFATGLNIIISHSSKIT